MTTTSDESKRARWVSIGVCEATLVGALVCVGWTLHDAGVFLRTGSPSTFLGLVPGSLVVIAMGAALGALMRARIVFALVALLALAGSLAPFVVEIARSRAEIWVPRAAFLLVCAWFAATVLGQRTGRGRASLALAFGILACVAKSVYRHGMLGVELPLVAAAAVLILTALPRPIRSASVARLVALLALVVPTVWYALDAAPRARTNRPDFPPPSTKTSAERPNLLLVVLDTLRADRLRPYGYARVTTPALDRFATQEAVRYTNSFSTSPWTLPSHSSLFTGLLPAEHGATNPRVVDDTTLFGLAIRPAQPLGPDNTTIAEVLRDAGYQTAAIVSNCAYLNHKFGVDQGFEHYDDRRDTYVMSYIALAQLGGRSLEVGHLPYRDAEEITNCAIDWLDKRRKDTAFFLMLNYMEAHEPYLTPSKYADAFEPDRQPIDPIKGDPLGWSLEHDRALLYLDEHLGRLLDALKAREVFDNTVVVVTSDHGQSLGDHGLNGHAWTLYNPTVRVPLYVKPAGGRTTEVDETLIDGTGTHDVMLQLLGFPVAPRSREASPDGWVSELYAGLATYSIKQWAASVGRNLEANLIAWQEGSTKFIVGSDGSVQAFDLENDPREAAPLELSEQEIARVTAIANAWWAAHPPPEAIEVDMDEDLKNQMQELGYTGDDDEQ